MLFSSGRRSRQSRSLHDYDVMREVGSIMRNSFLLAFLFTISEPQDSGQNAVGEGNPISSLHRKPVRGCSRVPGISLTFVLHAQHVFVSLSGCMVCALQPSIVPYFTQLFSNKTQLEYSYAALNAPIPQ